MKAIRSIDTTMITERVGSLVKIQGIRLNKANIKKYLSVFGGFLNPYFKESKKIIIVKNSEIAVGIAPIPAPFDNCPKNTTKETIDQINQV